MCQLAAAHDVPTFTHVAYMSRIDPESAAEAYIRLIGYAGATGAAHAHLPLQQLQQDGHRALRRAGGQGAGAGPADHGGGLSVRHRFDCAGGGLLQRPRVRGAQWHGYDSVQRVHDGRRFRDRQELLAAQATEPSTLVLWHILDTENNPHHRDLLDMSVLYPGGAIASDAMPWTLSDGSAYTGDAWPLPADATSHPRSAGCFTRFIREWVRERRRCRSWKASANAP